VSAWIETQMGTPESRPQGSAQWPSWAPPARHGHGPPASHPLALTGRSLCV